MIALDARLVSKRYLVREPGALLARRRIDALKSASIAIEEGEIFGIVGESGSGKSTLARIMIGALAPDSGVVHLYGEIFRPAERADRRRMTQAVQLVLQDSTGTLDPRLPLAEAVAFGPWSRGKTRAEARRVAEGALERVGLPPGQFARRLPSEVSGGQRQRVNLARAIALEPKILFLDEPVSALDKTVQAQILNLLVELGRDLGLTMVLISHDLDVIRYLCARTAVMREGEIVEEGPTARLFASPGHPYTQALIATLPRLEATPTARVAAAPAPKLAAAPPLFEVSGLEVAFARHNGETLAVRGVSLSLAAGEVLAVVGESGSGKSVMLRALLGLLPPTAEVSGRISLNGQTGEASNAAALVRLRGRVAGMVFQDPLGSLDPMAPIGRQIEDVVIALRSVARAEARAIALSLLERVHLGSAAERYGAMPHELSGGQRQRIGVALALAGEPAVLLADEPTTALDASVQARILELLRGLCAETGIGLVLVTHDMAVAREMADRVAVMYAGRIVEEGGADAILDAPRHPYSRALVRSYIGVRRRVVPLPSLAGAPPRLDSDAKGCAFAARCPSVEECCRILPPPSVTTASRRCECVLAMAEG
jgi:peptide/nickel transport system ATP-binding protein